MGSATVRRPLRARRLVSPWEDIAPIRSELFGPERFDEHAISLADSEMVVRRAAPVVSILQRLNDNADALVNTYDFLAKELREKRTITPAAEWLVDNFHSVETHVRQVRQDLPPGYFEELPKLGTGFLEGHPRIFGIVWAYVAHTDSRFDPELLGRYIRSYESRKALTLGELWAAPIHLRLVLIENLRRVADLVVSSAEDRQRADRLADALLGTEGHPARPLTEVLPNADTFRPSRAYAVQLVRRLSGAHLSEPADWLNARLDAEGIDADALMHSEHQSQARNTVTIRNIFTSLRLISDVNWEDWLESVSLIEDDLRSHSSYADLDFPTRNYYRSAIERLARGANQEEIDVTRAALYRAAHAGDDLAQDVGYWIVGPGLEEFAESIGYRPTARERLVRAGRRVGLAGYLGALTVATAVGLALGLALVAWVAGGLPWGVVLALGLLGSLPLSDLALGLVNYWSARLFHASVLPALALREGITDQLRTLVVIPTMITSDDGVDELLDQIEVHYLANSGGETYFALVTDWADSPTEHQDDDDELLARAQAGISTLNERYGDRFLLFHRTRQYNASEGVWMGWERKRGKLDELNRLLRGDRETSYVAIEGRLPGRFQYVVTVDSDTRLPREAVKRLVAKISHPLNRPVYDPKQGRVTRGYGILQPRVTPSLPLTEGSSFVQRVYSTPRGLDPYAFAVSDVYQDLFGEGSFAGKGIYDIDAVDLALEGRVPENTLLSHDLLEGNYARSGLVTDVEVVEEYPMAYGVAASRAHRWVRGDWQLLPWMLRHRRGLSALGQWKMWDNLRRSLSPIALVLAILAGLALLPPVAALVWSLVVVSSFFIPPLVPIAGRILRWREGITAASQLRGLGEDIRQGLVLGLTNLTFLSHQAWMMADAIVRTLGRLLFTRKNLLEWTTAAAAQRQSKGSLTYYVTLMWGGVVAPVLALLIGILRGPGILLVALPFVLLWGIAPVIARWASTPTGAAEIKATDGEIEALRLVARRTWHFFETFVNADENNLPPDNFQDDPAPIVATRTSPTNVGLYLLTTIGARDFGWIGRYDAIDRLAATMDTLRRLELYRGHLYNWYDTRTLRPLEPRYVSTVDSGNLAGHLLAVANTCRQWIENPTGHTTPGRGVLDAVGLVHQALGARPDEEPEVEVETPVAIEPMGESHRRVIASLAAISTAVAPLSEAPSLAGHLDELEDLTERLIVDAENAVEDGADPEVLIWARAILRSLESQRRDERATEADEQAFVRTLAEIEDQARRMTAEMDFGFLFDEQRSLLSIGYQLNEGRLDGSCYDLLASEARLASLVAIAKGDVRTRHWFLLGRTVTAVGGGAALLSWSGSMFEYLMPPLVMRAPSTGLLQRTAELVVRRQMEYGAELDIPWGVSESAYNARDVEFTYQYSPFGVPGLGIVRGLADNVVIAPYATGLAAMVEPGAAAANYDRLAGIGARGRYGYYEAVDFTPSRVPTDERYAVVHCYMAHHQGMSIVAIHNLVHDGLMRERFHAEPMIRASELLLQERAPRDVPVTHARREEVQTSQGVRTFVPPIERRITGPDALRPAVHQLSNGDLSLTLTAAGGGQLRWRGRAITRWHPDPTTDSGGDVVFLRDDVTGRAWSATPLPMLGGRETADVRFTEDRATYTRRVGGFTTELTYHLSPEADAMVRRLTITNRKRNPRKVTVSTYAELVLGQIADDDAHPAFSKMFVHTEFLADRGALIATRRRRSPGDPETWAGHLVVVDEGRMGKPVPESDRARFLGRGRTLRDPRMLRPGARPSGSTGYVLDPILSLTQRVRVPGQGKVRVYLWTFAAASREELLRLIDQHRSEVAYERIGMLAWTHSQVQLRHLRISADEAGVIQMLTGHVMFPPPALRPPQSALVRDAGPQSLLWPMSISGDLPIVVVRIEEDQDIELVRQLIRAFEYWRLKRFAVDLVILNDRSTSYTQDLQRALETLATSIRPRTGAPDSTGRIFVLRSDQLAPASRDALLAAARIVLLAQQGDLATQMQRVASRETPERLLAITTEPEVAVPSFEPSSQARPTDLLFDNGLGGFTPDGREYVTVLDPGWPTPAPWTNVVANEEFGFHATAEGAGYTWWRNSRDNQLTPWRNDPVIAPVSEALYVRDDATGRVVTPTASPIDAGRHIARHGFGYTWYEHESDELRLDLIQFVPLEDPVKISWLTLTNRTGTARSVTVTSYAEVLLGMRRHVNARFLQTSIDEQTRALFVRNPWSTEFGDQVVIADLGGTQQAWTGDRLEFLGYQGTMAAPACLAAGAPLLSGRVGAGLDPCAALQRQVVIQPGESIGMVVLLGAARDEAAARDLVTRYRAIQPATVLAQVRTEWDRRLGQIQVSTPDASFDVMMNGWLLYQTLACRMLARSGYYQASGAYGFRDQLQDSMATVLVDPALARGHVLRAAGRQFLEGDVQHWWLPASGMGVRTRISDDVVWLAHAVARYVSVTGDVAILDEQISYLEGRVLDEDEHEAFFQPETSTTLDTLYDHCVRALRRAFEPGAHGLPLMGTGDWNDGMNRVGQHGNGESVWLGWFLHTTLSRFVPLAERRGDTDFVEACRAEQERLLAALESQGWDGLWYRRGYFDDGTPLGSSGRSECRIDAIAQSWAVLSGAARPERAEQAMEEVNRQLIMHKEGVARLFTPPFDVSEPDPGYIRAYPPGVRENGGQYTHGALWSIFAYAAMDRQDRAGQLFSLINPVNHASSPERTDTYRVEPYVVAADVYSVDPHVGRGGWTWYTGSSGWMFRAGLEAVLGLLRDGDGLLIRPCLPPSWEGARVRYAVGASTYVVTFSGEPGDRPRRVVEIDVDGAPLLGTNRVSLVDDGREHHVQVRLEPIPPRVLDLPGGASGSSAR